MKDELRWDDRLISWAYSRPWWLRILLFPIFGPLIAIWFYRTPSEPVQRVMDEFKDDE